MAGRPRLRRWVTAGALIPLTAALAALAPASKASVAPRGAPSVAAGNAHSCTIERGRAYCWGENDFGQLGDGSTANSSVPVAVDTSGALAGKTITQISAGGGGGIDTCALDSAGTAYCWGSNADGGLGDGSTSASSSVPVAVDTSGALAGKTITQISAGSDGGCVLDSAGAAFCWGDNDYGELGNGHTTSSDVPVAVRTSGALAGKTLTQITAGFQDTCGLDSGGAAYCWGDNFYLELGNGSGRSFVSVPVAVNTSGVLAGQVLTQISAGWSYECAVDATGAAYCWGSGELGQNGTGSSGVPVTVEASGVLAGKALTQVSAGFGEACALDRAGAAYCWGSNDNGELGDGGTADSGVPVAVKTSGVLAGKVLTQVDAGAFHACAADTADATYCWGDNNQGDLGNDSTIQSDVPVLAGPRAPTMVTAVPGHTRATTSWSAPSSLDGGTLTGYTATAAPGGAACTTRGATRCTITGLTDGTTYRISVAAHTTVGDSGASRPATVTPRAGAPTNGPIVSGYRATLCVDDPGDVSANGTKVMLADCNAGAEQSWTIEAGRTIRIHGKCMDIRGGATRRAPVELWTCTGGANQKWRAEGGTLVNPASGKCLDDPKLSFTNGTQLDVFPCDGGATQQWKLP